jgi:adenosylcobinamide-GDP ribazoletransferase
VRLFLAALAFYTRLPIPNVGVLPFEGVARIAPIIGILIGIGLSLLDSAMAYLRVPLLLRSSLVVAAWVWITGGLHLDGVMDTADGLSASKDQEHRLRVMADPATGAFGVMAGVMVLLLKVSALASLGYGRPFGLMLAAGWGRWGQVIAIARYPYLRAAGKGAFHKQGVRSLKAAIPTGLLLIGLSLLPIVLGGFSQLVFGRLLFAAFCGMGLASLVVAWFARQLGGHTGDTYGATVEWTEAIFLCIWCGLWS